MNIVIMAIGIPGSGKTTLLSPLAEEFGMARINRDDIRKERFGDPHTQEHKEEVTAEADQRLLRALSQNAPVLLDSIFVNPDERRRVITKAREAGAIRIIGIVFTTPLAVAKERNRLRKHIVQDEVMDKLHQKLSGHPPSLDEGFDVLYTDEQIETLKLNELF